MIAMVRQILCLILAIGFILPFEAFSETKLGSSVESRVTLAFKVNDAAAQAMLPDGWKLLTLPKGPFAGANLLVVFIDKHLYADAEGKPLDPHDSRTVGTVSYGVKEGIKGARLFLTSAYETAPVLDPYGNSALASITRKASIDGDDNRRLYQENWRLQPASGGELTIDLSYQSGKPKWITASAKPYSNKNPEFYRIYNYQQLAELVSSKALGKPVNGSFSFDSTIPELAELFDGSEELQGIMVAPTYQRRISLP